MESGTERKREGESETHSITERDTSETVVTNINNPKKQVIHKKVTKHEIIIVRDR